MAARAPSLEIFEHLAAISRWGEAFAEARAILNSINNGHGLIDGVAWKASPTAVSETGRLAEFATRFCAAFGALASDPAFCPANADFIAFCGARRWVDTLFRVSAFGSSDHLLEAIGRGSNGEAWCFEGSAPLRFLMVWSPDSALKLEAREWLDGQGAIAAAAWLAHIGARACLTRASAAFRESLLEVMTDPSATWRLDPAMLPWIVEPYLHCSYAAGPRKHAIKGLLMKDMRRHLLAAGCAEAPARAAPRERPVIVVTAEYFSQGHSVHRTHSRAIRGLRGSFHVIGLINAGQRGPRVDDCFDEIIDLPQGGLIDGARAAAKFILARAPDIVFHTGVGLSPRVTALAALRLAPVQCASFGHTATTMSPAIDYFALPEDYAESPGAFSEKILALPADAFPYEPRVEQLPPRARRADGAAHIAIAASLPKLNAALLAALGEISRRADRPVVFEFFPLGAAGLAHLELTLALARALPGAVAHQQMPHAEYMAALARCDFFLSPFPYGNMNSILDAAALGLPGVCLDGAEPHARADAAIFARLGLPRELIAGDAGAYIAAAARLINDADFRARANDTAAAIDWRARFCEGDDCALGRALLDLIKRA